MIVLRIVHKELLVSDEHVQDLQSVMPGCKVQDVPLVDVCLSAPRLPVLGNQLSHELVPVDHR